eukprot:TRINITY_DN93_c1_g1_i1.p1 TRINITY_DN93_c1_g1~~TRINITY_DN93_c1_g1_i1.p1  ORF type:complete len:1205 (+),score=293.85 TRINITY_DN93_c1_g1_i1:180-3617(+)
MADVLSGEGKTNCVGTPVQVTQMQSELGAAGAVHGAASAGALVTTFTASQGLLLMVPAMYKVVGELLPVVFHVAARQVASNSNSIYGEHSDVMATRHTGISMLCSHSVQEVMDLALVSHVAALRSSLPFLHFFDGFQVSHEMQKIKMIPHTDMVQFLDAQLVQKFRDRSINPMHPRVRSMLNNRDTLFQAVEANNSYFAALPEVVEQAMKDVAKLTGRPHGLFEYAGSPRAERVVVMMGAGSQAVGEVVEHMGDVAVGYVKVHLFRPWSIKHFLAVLPPTVKIICTLDRCREPSAIGEPLFMDVSSSVQQAGLQVRVIGGRYGLGDKAFTPAMVKAVYDNMVLEHPKHPFTVGIEDDVTHLSLPVGPVLHTVPEGTKQCIFWGLGSDGTVGANRVAIQLIGKNTPLYTQGYFFFTAHKAGGITTSHLRFGPQQICSSYPIQAADYIACHHPTYVRKYPLLEPLKEGGVFVLNCVWPRDEVAAHLTASVRRQLAQRKAKFYVINAYAISKAAGLGGHINLVMQTVFFKLAHVIDVDSAVALLKESVVRAYAKKGADVIACNQRAIDEALSGLAEVAYPASWADEKDPETAAPLPASLATADNEFRDWIKKIKLPLDALEGDKFPVSYFSPFGHAPTGTTQFEKRGIATQIPMWNADTCVQCTTCSFVCPHAAIRPFLCTADQAANAPEGFIVKPAKGITSKDKMFRIQVSPLDCTGCGLCTCACPVKGTLQMAPIDEVREKQSALWDFCAALPRFPCTPEEAPQCTLKGSQLLRPLFEFCGACAGCGEGAYLKLISQLFGERLVVANAAGCSSAIALIYGSTPYSRSELGWGPCLSSPLFENNAEYGFGCAKGHTLLREKLVRSVKALLGGDLSHVSQDLQAALKLWLDNVNDRRKSLEQTKVLYPLLEKEHADGGLLEKIYKERDAFPKISHWLVGGDGWAYDIDFAGVDHVLAQGHDVRVLILDTELYSNTGGQKSKGSSKGSVLKFASAGHQRNKKDFGEMMMSSYDDIYIAQVALNANPAQALRAFIEADEYDGPSVVIAYCPCIEHGITSTNWIDETRLAVASGYWPLYRYNPSLKKQGKNPLQLDSTVTKTVEEFLKHENRFQRLVRERPDRATKLHAELVDFTHHKFAMLKQKAEAKQF